MTITIDPTLETYVQEHAEFMGLTVEAYIQRLVSAGRIAEIDSIDSIQRGLADVQAGRVTPLRKFEAEFRANAGLPSRTR